VTGRGIKCFPSGIYPEEPVVTNGFYEYPDIADVFPPCNWFLPMIVYVVVRNVVIVLHYVPCSWDVPRRRAVCMGQGYQPGGSNVPAGVVYRCPWLRR